MNSTNKATRSLAEIQAIIDDNNANRRQSYEGLLSHEIGTHSRSIMFGENDQAFPSQEEWSRIVD